MKNNRNLKNLLSFVIVLALIAAAAFTFASCTGNSDKTGQTTEGSGSISGTEAPEAEIQITVVVTDDKGEDTTFTISTSAKTLRAALEQENLIEGDESDYGLYVKFVNGVRADYDADKAYWAFYKSGVMLNTGVDTIEISDGDHYEIKYTK